MSRPCPSCGSHLCDSAACFLEPDPDVIEFWANFDELRKAQNPQKDEADIPSAIEHAITEVRSEIARAIAKFPTWPTDPLHAVAVFGEEAGELTKAVLQDVYEPGKNRPNAVRDEAMQAAAMAIRFLASINEYKFEEGPQHVVR